MTQTVEMDFVTAVVPKMPLVGPYVHALGVAQSLQTELVWKRVHTFTSGRQ